MTIGPNRAPSTLMRRRLCIVKPDVLGLLAPRGHRSGSRGWRRPLWTVCLKPLKTAWDEGKWEFPLVSHFRFSGRGVPRFHGKVFPGNLEHCRRLSFKQCSQQHRLACSQSAHSLTVAAAASSSSGRGSLYAAESEDADEVVGGGGDGDECVDVRRYKSSTV